LYTQAAPKKYENQYKSLKGLCWFFLIPNLITGIISRVLVLFQIKKGAIQFSIKTKKCPLIGGIEFYEQQ